MSTVNERFAALLTQTNALISLLPDAFAAEDTVVSNVPSEEGDGESASSRMVDGFERYAQQVESIVQAAEGLTESGEFLGLYNLCILFREALGQLVSECDALSEELLALLTQWPVLLLAYIENPVALETGTALIEHLQHPAWPMPLPAEEAELLSLLFMEQAAAIPEEDSTAVTTAMDGAPGLEMAADVAEVFSAAAVALEAEREPDVATAAATDESSEPSEEMAGAMEELLEVSGIDNEIDAESMAMLFPAEASLAEAAATLEAVSQESAEASMPMEEAVPWTTEEASDLEALALQEAPAEALASMAWETDGSDDDEAVPWTTEEASDLEALALQEAPAEALASMDWEVDDTDDEAMPWTTEEASDLEALALQEAPDEDTAEPLATTAWEAEEATAEAMPWSAAEAGRADVDAMLEELVEEEAAASTAALPAEAAEISDGTEDEAMNAAEQEVLELFEQEILQLTEALQEALAGTPTDGWQAILEEHAEELERVGEGAESIGLTGLQGFSSHLRNNLEILATRASSLSAVQQQLLVRWSQPVVTYLRAIHATVAHDTLIQYLQDPAWPQPLDAAEAATLREALAAVALDIGEEDEAPRQRHAQLADISLALQEDANPDLLDTLLREMPQRTADFSAAIQRLSGTAGTLEDVEEAQRIAHALKGAANTVGVPGVANLTHHIEDILLAFSKHEALPTPALTQTLINAADCLEVMSEALSGFGDPPPPQEALGVLQAVLDWANLIDQEGVPAEDMQPRVRETLPGLVAAAQAVPAQDTQDMFAAAAETSARAAETSTSLHKQVGEDVVDELLRLAGEGMILNGQLQDRLARTVQHMRAVRAQNVVLQQLVNELEHLVDIRGLSSPLLQRASEGDFDPLELEQYNEIHTVTRRLIEASVDARELGHEVDSSLEDLDDLLAEQRKIQRENEEMVMRSRMVPIKTIAPRLQRGVRQACRLTGKEVELVLHGGETLMDSQVLTSMIDPLMHLLRNAVDHGIESPVVREQAGKPRTGKITLEFAREGSSIVVRCQDDGAGLDYEAIRRIALERGLINDTQIVTNETELGRLILLPGFSTRSYTTQVSGRGIGMDAVYSRIQELKGSLTLSSETHKGCLIELRLPVSLLSTHGLLVRTGKRIVAVASRGIQQILYPGEGVLGQISNKMTYQIGEEMYEATPMEALLDMPSQRSLEDWARCPGLFLQEPSGRQRVVLVNEVLASQTMVVKNLGNYVPPIKGIAGATILGDGSVTPVLDLPDLLHRPLWIRRSRAVQAPATLQIRPVPVALVVDDSLSARRALAEFVKDLGFEIRMAGDGLEAVALLDRQTPSLVLVDLEMPRMNGLELTAHLRSREATRHVPVIMITSRSTEKHRQIADQVGVNAYLIKPFSEDELLSHIQRLTELKGAA